MTFLGAALSIALLTLGFRAHAAEQSAAPAKSPSKPCATSIAEEAALLENGRLHSKQNVFARLGVSTDPEADKLLLEQFDRYEAGNLPPALWLDLFEAAAQRKNAQLQARLRKRDQQLQHTADPLARFRECLEGGNGEAGRAVFATKPEAGCVRCHSIDGKGGEIGPDLTWLRHSTERMHLLESIILPNATLAAGFQPALLKLRSGEEAAGVITFETADELTLTSPVDGKKRKLKVADIVERTPLPSPMPPHFGAVLSKREIRDLVQFLAEGD